MVLHINGYNAFQTHISIKLVCTYVYQPNFVLSLYFHITQELQNKRKLRDKQSWTMEAYAIL